jgi:hypothetical protein
MKSIDDARILSSLAEQQRGVFSTADLRSVLADRHPASFARRVRALVHAGVLRRYVRGWYVTDRFDLLTLSQRLAPDSYISFGNLLARNLLIGADPQRQVMAAKPGRGRTYRALGFEVVHLGIAPHLAFGYHIQEGVRFADSEKAMLDVLYFHLRGRRFFFDPFSDVDVSRLDPDRLRRYLARYRNPKFVAFATNVLDLT